MLIGLIRWLDKYIGGLKCLAFGLFPKRRFIQPKRILAIQLWGLGESTLTLPALYALKKRFPEAKIEVLATKRNEEIYYKQPFKLRVVALNPFSLLSFVLNNKYDLVVDFEEYLNSSALVARMAGKHCIGFDTGVRKHALDNAIPYDDMKHTSETFFDLVRALGVKGEVEKLVALKVSDADDQAALRFMQEHKLNRFIGIAPGAAESSRQRIWPLDRFAKVADSLDHPVVFFGGPDETGLIEDVRKQMKKESFIAAGKLSLRQSFALVKRSKLFISNDSGLMHVAAAMDVPTIGLFGPNLPERWRPYNKKSTAIYKGHECSPCINSHKGEFPKCKFNDDNKCMKKINVEEVVKAARKMLK
ncbi:MAG: glycosyltransferase family 9 protein [Nanoarchaeota archaeon]|nr:glycosyltransferase family 9 protein [Nanoarchaeota archaeon]